MRTAHLAFALLVTAACVPAQGPLMQPGQDCLKCHDGQEARRWTLAGTWPPRGTDVTVTDSGGKSFTLRANEAGNFYTAEPLQFPVQVSVGGTPMPTPAVYGGCNHCHAGGAQLGPLMLPGRDCLSCHDGTYDVKKFTAAGTWTRPGLIVSLVDANGTKVDGTTDPGLVTNAAGNFYTTAPLVFPLRTATVDNGVMNRPSYGGCNSCHGGGANIEGGGG